MSTAPLRFELPTRRATIHLARRVARHVAAGDLLILSGPLGSGKTFFTRALCRAIGLPSRVPVTSPTFTLVHEFDTDPPCAHADLYRLAGPDDVRRLGLDAQRDEGRLLLVEWGEPYLELLGGDGLLVRFTFEPRAAELQASGERSGSLLEAIGRAPAPSTGPAPPLG